MRTHTYLTMATIAEDLPTPDSPTVKGIFVSQVNYIRLLVLTLGEVVKELYQRERQRGRAIDRGSIATSTTRSNAP